MPCRYHIRTFVKGGYYHIFNRGVEKNNIFRDIEDFRVFLYFLETSVTPPDRAVPRKRINFFERISIISFCLMLNHFHLIIHQKEERVLPQFMNSVISAYTRYFNEKYDRVGSIFQGRYKSKMIDSDAYLLHASRYIHLNPRDIGEDPFLYSFSSLGAYIGGALSWIDTEMVLNLISKDQEKQKEKYKKFCLLEMEDFDDPFRG